MCYTILTILPSSFSILAASSHAGLIPLKLWFHSYEWTVNVLARWSSQLGVETILSVCPTDRRGSETKWNKSVSVTGYSISAVSVSKYSSGMYDMRIRWVSIFGALLAYYFCLNPILFEINICIHICIYPLYLICFHPYSLCWDDSRQRCSNFSNFAWHSCNKKFKTEG